MTEKPTKVRSGLQLLLNFLVYILRPSVLDKYNSLALASSLLFYTSYITLIPCIPLIVCKEMHSNQRELLLLDMSVVCWQGTHIKYMRLLVFPSLILNVIAQ